MLLIPERRLILPSRYGPWWRLPRFGLYAMADDLRYRTGGHLAYKASGGHLVYSCAAGPSCSCAYDGVNSVSIPTNFDLSISSIQIETSCVTTTCSAAGSVNQQYISGSLNGTYTDVFFDCPTTACEYLPTLIPTDLVWSGICDPSSTYAQDVYAFLTWTASQRNLVIYFILGDITCQWRFFSSTNSVSIADKTAAYTFNNQITSYGTAFGRADIGKLGSVTVTPR